MLINCSVTVQLICIFGYAYADCWGGGGAMRQLLLLSQADLSISFYAPNFKEVEGAYWFGSVRAVQ